MSNSSWELEYRYTFLFNASAIPSSIWVPRPAGSIMITTLHIKNIGIIEDITIDLNEGLNVLTGETGAGKTLIIDSLQIISGDRFSKEMIRKGQEY